MVAIITTGLKCGGDPGQALVDECTADPSIHPDLGCKVVLWHLLDLLMLSFVLGGQPPQAGPTKATNGRMEQKISRTHTAALFPSTWDTPCLL